MLPWTAIIICLFLSKWKLLTVTVLQKVFSVQLNSFTHSPLFIFKWFIALRHPHLVFYYYLCHPLKSNLFLFSYVFNLLRFCCEFEASFRIHKHACTKFGQFSFASIHNLSFKQLPPSHRSVSQYRWILMAVFISVLDYVTGRRRTWRLARWVVWVLRLSKSLHLSCLSSGRQQDSAVGETDGCGGQEEGEKGRHKGEGKSHSQTALRGRRSRSGKLKVRRGARPKGRVVGRIVFGTTQVVPVHLDWQERSQGCQTPSPTHEKQGTGRGHVLFVS